MVWIGLFDAKDLLQLDGTVMAGILILMTVSAYYDKKYTLKFWGHPRETIYLSLVPFAISAMAILGTGLPNSPVEDTVESIAVLSSATGFTILMIAVSLLLYAAHKNQSGSNIT